MDRNHIPIVVLSIIAMGAAVSLGAVCQETPDYFPIPAPSAQPIRPVAVLIAPAEQPTRTLTPPPTVVASRPAPTPTPPAYDDSDIPDLDGDSCGDGCIHWVCHYDKGDTYGYHRGMGPRTEAAHMAQHPDDYRDNEWGIASHQCRDLPHPAVESDDDE